MNHVSIGVIALSVFISINASAVSFDCDKVATSVEEIICSDDNLSILDDQLSLAYKRASKNTKDINGLRAAQSYWLRFQRNKCEDNSCLETKYVSRISWLNNAYLRGNNSTLQGVTGTYIRFLNGKPTNDGKDWMSLKVMNDEYVIVKGLSIWVGNIETGHVNVGVIDGIAVLNGSNIFYEWGQCRLTVSISKEELKVIDHNLGCGGMNVYFGGKYRKVDISAFQG